MDNATTHNVSVIVCRKHHISVEARPGVLSKAQTPAPDDWAQIACPVATSQKTQIDI
jgi:hypothetical protein